MKKSKILLASLTPLIFLTSCLMTTGNWVVEDYSPYKTEQKCGGKAINISTYFEEEICPYSYQALGTIEIKGGKNDDYEKLIDYLKYETWSRCGNAAINISKTYTQREKGRSFNEEYNEIYDAPVISATIVKIESNDDLGFDTSYVSTVRKDNKLDGNVMAIEAAGSLILGIGMAVNWIAKN